MANNIKGLVVQIGGDTSELSKALDGVNKKSKDLSSELGQINRMLKLDPGNTELLAQKQKVLADAIENTGKKLDTLKEAEKQVQAQFERGEVSEAQYRALQREVITTERKLGSYKQAAQETTDALQNLGKATDGTADDVSKTGKGATDTGNKLDKLAKSADKAGDAGEGMGSKFASAAKGGLKAVAAAAGAAITGLAAASESTQDYRMEMGKLDTAFTQNGFSSEAATGAYTDLVGILGEYDQSVEAANHLAKLTDNEKDLATWTGDILPGVFATFGDSLPIEGLTEAANETAKVGQVTGPLADALNWAGVSEDEFNESLAACTTEQERQALITETLTGLYGDASEAYKETNSEVIRANIANNEWMKSLAGVGAAFGPVMTDVKMMGASILSDLVPGVEALSTAFRGLLSGEDGAAADLGAALGGIITDLLNKVTEMAPTLVQVGVSLLTTLTTTIISMLPQLAIVGFEIITTLLNGVTQAIPQLTAAIVAMIPQLTQALVTGIPQLITGAVMLFSALVQAIPQILPPLIAALPQIITAIVNGLVSQVPTLVSAAITLLMAIVQAVPQIIQALVPQIPTIVSAVVSALIQAAPTLLAGAIQLFWEIIKAIPTIIAELAKVVPNIIAGIVNGLLNGLGKVGSAALKIGKTLLDKVISGVKDLPSKIYNTIKGALGKVVSWGSELAGKGKNAAKELLNSVVNGLKDLPGKVMSVGKDLVTGLWNGVNDKLSWLKNKISGFASSVLNGIKSFFGVNSPSKETAWIGEMLDEGLAEGMLDNVGKPVKAMKRVTGDVLGAAEGFNGLSLDRQRQAGASAAAAATMANSGMGAKLDAILAAIERGQVLTIDGNTFIGATADGYDNRLGQRRALAARGAL